ncbi:MAG: hypothetical protein ACRCVI_03155 [Mycoplasmoidaceae bacterium]
MECIIDKILIDVNGLISNNDDRKNHFIHEWIINLLVYAEEHDIQIFLISSNKDARSFFINQIAEDIDANVSIQIFDPEELKKQFDLWKKKNNITKCNCIIGLTSEAFLEFLKTENYFTFFLDSFNLNNNFDLLTKETSYLKPVDISNLIEELPNILFKLDSFIEKCSKE